VKAKEFRQQWSHKPTPIPQNATGLWYSEECVDQLMSEFAANVIPPGPRPICPKCGYADGVPLYPPTEQQPNMEVACPRCGFSVMPKVDERGYVDLEAFAQFFPVAAPSATPLQVTGIPGDILEHEYRHEHGLLEPGECHMSANTFHCVGTFWTEKEISVIDQLAKKQELSHVAVLRQALRNYQLIIEGVPRLPDKALECKFCYDILPNHKSNCRLAVKPKLKPCPECGKDPFENPICVPESSVGMEQVAAAKLAQQFHESYERLAREFGYETRKESAKPWSEVPESNRKLMTAVCSEVIESLRRSGAQEEVVFNFSPSPCGHSSQYAYTENGGKNIVCLLCERGPSPATAPAQPEPHTFKNWLRGYRGIRHINDWLPPDWLEFGQDYGNYRAGEHNGQGWDIEAISAKVHEQWIESKLSKGITSRKLESGEELIVPYAKLTEEAKDLDRGSVRAVLAAISALPAPPEGQGAEKE
jgi:DNA-directed RNA polymerase subunit RPC12/RpoP